MPPEVVRKAIVNAVAHRDYTSTGSVQVMLFADRLEVWNPGTLPPTLTLKQLRRPHASVPGNPLLAEALDLTKYIERMGTGTGDMIERCRSAGLPEPAFALTDGFVATLRRRPGRAYETVAGAVTGEVTGQVAGEVTGEVTGEVAKLLVACQGIMTRKALQESLALKGEDNFRKLYLTPALALGAMEMTIPDKPNSRSQKYRLTNKGRVLLRALQSGRKKP
jgi:predicted HTH transcriptional regulator